MLLVKVLCPGKPQSLANPDSSSPSQIASERMQGMLQLPCSAPLYWVRAPTPQLWSSAPNSSQLSLHQAFPSPALPGEFHTLVPSANGDPHRGTKGWAPGRVRSELCMDQVKAKAISSPCLLPHSPYPASLPPFLLKTHPPEIPCIRTLVLGSAFGESDLIRRGKHFFF